MATLVRLSSPFSLLITETYKVKRTTGKTAPERLHGGINHITDALAFAACGSAGVGLPLVGGLASRKGFG